MSGRLLFALVQAPLGLVLTAWWSALACVAALLDRSGRTTRRIGGIWSRQLLRLLRVTVELRGAGCIPRGPAVYAANHASVLDILIVFGCLPVDFRIIYKRSLSLVPLLGWAIRLGGHLPIDRRNPLRARRSLAAAARRLSSGTSVVVFPEGTRSRDGSVGRFKRGSFALALEAGVPVVPVSLAGVKPVVPHGISSVRPGQVQVVIHPTMEMAARDPAEVDAIADEVRAQVLLGLGEGPAAAGATPSPAEVRA